MADYSRLASTRNPDIRIRGLFAHQWRDGSRDSAQLHLHNETRSLAAGAGKQKRLFAPGNDREFFIVLISSNPGGL